VTKLLLACAALAVMVAAAHARPLDAGVASCESAIMFTDPQAYQPGPDERTIFASVTLPRRDLIQIARVDGPWRYWRKAGVLVRASTRVTISIPRTWRRRAAISWGDSGVVSSLRFAPCSTHRWNAYAGGFYVRRPACVPLTIAVGRRVDLVHVGIGTHCA
jgi:hypothetical protein